MATLENSCNLLQSQIVAERLIMTNDKILCVIALFYTNITPITISGVYFGHINGLISFQNSLYIE